MKTISILSHHGDILPRVFSSFRDAKLYLVWFNKNHHHELYKMFSLGGRVICEFEPYKPYSFLSFRFDTSGNLVFSKVQRYGANTH